MMETTRSRTVCHLFSGDLWAGAEVVIWSLLTSLQSDASVRVVAVSLNEGVLTGKLRAAGVPTYVVSETEYSLLAIVRRAAQLLEPYHVDIIHSHRYKENVIAWLLARRLSVSELITTIHGLPESPSRTAGQALRERWRTAIDHVVVKRWFRHAVAVSEDTKRRLIEQYGFRESQIHVIRNGGRLPPTPTLPDGVRDYVHIGTVGRMVPVKGLDLFLEVAATIHRVSPSVRFSILGDGPLREALVRRAVDLNIRGCVDFLAPQANPFSYYESLDVYLNTSLHEGLPLSVVEAMACGKPIVSSAVGGIPEIVVDGEHGFLVHGREPRTFSDACLTLVGERDLRRRMGQRCSDDAHSRLSASAMAEHYRRLYAESLTRNSCYGRGAPHPRRPATDTSMAAQRSES